MKKTYLIQISNELKQKVSHDDSSKKYNKNFTKSN